MKFIFVAIFIMYFNNSNCQNFGKAPCDVLQTFLSIDKLIGELHLDKRQNGYVAILDTNNYFENCKIYDFYDKEVSVLKKVPEAEDKQFIYITIISLTTTNNKYNLEFICSSREVYGKVYFYYKRNKIRIKSYSIGNF